MRLVRLLPPLACMNKFVQCKTKRKRQGLIPNIVLLCFMSVVIYIGVTISSNYHEKQYVAYHKRQVCVHPKLNPFEGDYIKQHFHSVDPIKCAEDEDWILVSNGTVSIDRGAKTKHGNIQCNITYFERINDFKNTDLTKKVLNDEMKMRLEHDFFKAKCIARDGTEYDNVHAGVRYVSEYHKKIKDLKSGLGLDVLMLGFDSLSHMTYIRKLKKTYRYFTKDLKGVVLNGYNIVGDGTPQALIPILTGKTELELPSTLKRLPKKDFVDVYPMIWKDFRQKGYVTAWAEDLPILGTFTYRMTGFKDSPTDHYMRPFYVTASKEFHHKHKKLCLGSKRRSEVFINWIKDIYTMYDKVPKFVFGFHSELSHADNNDVETADDDLYNLLKFLNEGKYLQKTLVILMSDHGARFSKHRSSLQGKQEERLPFFGFSFPESFKSQYIESYQFFKMNVDRLTCPFDLHPTFLDILNYTGGGLGNVEDRGISLFKEIPISRSCEQAGIQKHWCACLNWTKLSTYDIDVKSVARYVVSKINKMTAPHRTLCQTLTLKHIARAQKLLPETNMLHFKKSRDVDGVIPDFSDNTTLYNIYYQVWVSTTPGDGMFEVTVNHDVHRNVFYLNEQSISRVNKYGDAPKCIEQQHEELRRYCYCKI